MDVEDIPSTATTADIWPDTKHHFRADIWDWDGLPKRVRLNKMVGGMITEQFILSVTEARNIGQDLIRLADKIDAGNKKS
jgi:hypothetical protein